MQPSSNSDKRQRVRTFASFSCSDEDDDDATHRTSSPPDNDEDHDDLPLTFMTRAERAKHTAAPQRTVYEVERDVKIREVLQGLQPPAAEAVPQPPSDIAMPSSSPPPPRRRYDTDRYSRGGSASGAPPPRRFGFLNQTEADQARFLRHRHNMAITRNALREVDPSTGDYMQVAFQPELPRPGDRFQNRGGGFNTTGSSSSSSAVFYGGRGGRGDRGRERGRGRGYQRGGKKDFFSPF